MLEPLTIAMIKIYAKAYMITPALLGAIVMVDEHFPETREDQSFALEDICARIRELNRALHIFPRGGLIDIAEPFADDEVKMAYDKLKAEGFGDQGKQTV